MDIGTFLRSVGPPGEPDAPELDAAESTAHFQARRDAAHASIVDDEARLAAADPASLAAVDPFPTTEPYYADQELRRLAGLYAAARSDPPPPPGDCPVCMEPIAHAVSLACRHSLCWQCWTAWRDRCHALHLEASCPVCRTRETRILARMRALYARWFSREFRPTLRDAAQLVQPTGPTRYGFCNLLSRMRLVQLDDPTMEARLAGSLGWMIDIAAQKAHGSVVRGRPADRLVVARRIVARQRAILDVLRSGAAEVAALPPESRETATRHLADLDMIQSNAVYDAQQDARRAEVDCQLELQVERPDGTWGCAGCGEALPPSCRRAHVERCLAPTEAPPVHVHWFVPHLGTNHEYSVFDRHAVTRERSTLELCRDLCESVAREPVTPTDRRAPTIARAFRKLVRIDRGCERLFAADDAEIAAALQAMLDAHYARLYLLD